SASLSPASRSSRDSRALRPRPRPRRRGEWGGAAPAPPRTASPNTGPARVPSNASAAGKCAVVRSLDERLDAIARLVVVDLLRRRLHEVGRGGDERAAEAAVQAELRAADRVDDHARAVRRVPDLELQLRVQR